MATVQRAPADKPGDEIVSSVLVTTDAQIERGRQEINYNSTDRIMKECDMSVAAYVPPGELIALQDSRGVSVGMLADITFKINEHGFVSSGLTVECVL